MFLDRYITYCSDLGVFHFHIGYKCLYHPGTARSHLSTFCISFLTHFSLDNSPLDTIIVQLSPRRFRNDPDLLWATLTTYHYKTCKIICQRACKMRTDFGMICLALDPHQFFQAHITIHHPRTSLWRNWAALQPRCISLLDWAGHLWSRNWCLLEVRKQIQNLNITWVTKLSHQLSSPLTLLGHCCFAPDIQEASVLRMDWDLWTTSRKSKCN